MDDNSGKARLERLRDGQRKAEIFNFERSYNATSPDETATPASGQDGKHMDHQSVPAQSALKSFLTSTLPIMSTIIVVAWVAYTRLDDSVSDTRKELAAQISTTETRFGDQLRASDAKLQSFRDRSEDTSRQMFKELADLRVRQVQVEAKQ